MRAVGLVTGGHYFHKLIMEANNAKMYNMGSGINRYFKELIGLPTGYDMYITESNFYSPIISEKLLRGKRPIVANIAGSPFIYTNPLAKLFLNGIDYMFVEGRFGEEMIRKIGYKNKVKIVYPSLMKDRIKILREFKYKPPKNMQITTVANGNWKIKGVDILVRGVGEFNPEAKINIIGESDYRPKSENIIMHGKLDFDGIIKVFENTSVYVQSSRFDTFSISAMEAVLAGIPTIVSNMCGAREILGDKYTFASGDYHSLDSILEVVCKDLAGASVEMKKRGVDYIKNVSSAKEDLVIREVR